MADKLMRPRLDANWRNILRYAWSIKWMAVAGLLSAVEVVLPLFVDVFPRGLFAGLSIVATAGGFWARIMAQRNLP